ncbi:MAG TPA: HypC/HybG/HupF family hydrogenase formation chaperone [Rhodocyclaceae bacterium]|nr:HypC/HybG/HupF family hydrogenase formation chaperone [Rhodocyclaceae bacterium]
MCLAVPSKVIELDGDMATVEAFGQARRVSLLLMNEDVILGDYLLIQAGGFAFERVEIGRAEEALRVMAEMMAAGSTDVRAW